MGYLLNGTWHEGDPTASESGEFRRKASSFRDFLTADGKHPAAAGRYHLYVSLACPWAHRTLIMRALKGLEAMIGVSTVHWLMGKDGWTFEIGDGAEGDPLFGAAFLREIYQKADATYSGRVTVPVLWDKEQQTIVSNESSEILRMFGTAFDALGARPGDYYPEHLRAEIDPINVRVYETVNNGVYKSGFARTQTAYETAAYALFETLDWLDSLLADKEFLAGDTLTEADIRLYTTLVRFMPVYAFHFKCNLRPLDDYGNLSVYLAKLHAMDGFHTTTDFTHIKNHYYQSHESINPTRIVPIGPRIAP
ncbi:MAG: glutathione S-transferase family protein [Pseudomonadota bacterium]